MPFSIFLMKQFLQTLPTELIEAARMDGCGEWGVFQRVILPLAKPGMGVAGHLHLHGRVERLSVAVDRDQPKLDADPAGWAQLSAEPVLHRLRPAHGRGRGVGPAHDRLLSRIPALFRAEHHDRCGEGVGRRYHGEWRFGSETSPGPGSLPGRAGCRKAGRGRARFPRCRGPGRAGWRVARTPRVAAAGSRRAGRPPCTRR